MCHPNPFISCHFRVVSYRKFLALLLLQSLLPHHQWMVSFPRRILPSLSASLFPSCPPRLFLAISLSLSSFLFNGGQARSPLMVVRRSACIGRASQTMPNRLGPAQLEAKRRRWQHVQKPQRDGIQTPSSSQFTVILWSYQVHLDLLIKMVSSITDESVRIISTYFCAKIKTLQVNQSQTKTYFEVTMPNSYSWRKMIPNDIKFAYV